MFFKSLIHHRGTETHRKNFTSQRLRAKSEKPKAKSDSVYLEQQKKLAIRVRAFLREKYQIELANVVIEQPPKVEMGEFALPLSFELAKRLRKSPRKIAEEIVAELPLPDGFGKLEVGGAGYINVRLKREIAARVLANGETTAVESHEGEGAANVSGKILVEHTSINPNKAAHIGHLRNAILGDTFVRLLRAAGQKVDVQNYIDNTGVQVADVVVGFLYLEQSGVPGVPTSEQHTLAGIKGLMAYLANEVEANPSNRENLFDYYCWRSEEHTSELQSPCNLVCR